MQQKFFGQVQQRVCIHATVCILFGHRSLPDKAIGDSHPSDAWVVVMVCHELHDGRPETTLDATIFDGEDRKSVV